MAQHSSLPGATDTHLAAVDDLLARPFPAQELRWEAHGTWGGPGYHLSVLRESQDFWEDRDEEIVEAATRELEADLAVLAAGLTVRWGNPETVDLEQYLGYDDLDPQHAVPEPLLFLSTVASTMQVWRPPDSDRWLALTIGQADPEFPLQLIAALGLTTALEH
ncbi:hypothetical protein ACFXG6_20130 [Streptomyces roseus]|uniref:hypothetical protein n=1 Tax=Streptomyces roseus TaxID=66430 RepID=UPI0036AC3517